VKLVVLEQQTPSVPLACVALTTKAVEI